MIDGVRIVPRVRIPDERGTIMHMLKATDPEFLGFGEIYFSTVYPGVVKGWHRHAEMTLNYACVARPDQAGPVRRSRRLADARRDHGALPRSGRLQPRPDPARRLERIQGDGPRRRDRGELLHPLPRPFPDRPASIRSTTTSPTTGASGSTDAGARNRCGRVHRCPRDPPADRARSPGLCPCPAGRPCSTPGRRANPSRADRGRPGRWPSARRPAWSRSSPTRSSTWPGTRSPAGIAMPWPRTSTRCACRPACS